MKIKKIFIAFIFCVLLGTVIYSWSKAISAGGTGYIGGTGGTGGTGTANTVGISGMLYSPASITVKVGTTVKWTNSDIYSVHTVTSDDGASFNSGNIATGSSFSFTPTVGGTFAYHCNIHGTGMAGTLKLTP